MEKDSECEEKITKEENEHDVIEEMEDRCCGSPGL